MKGGLLILILLDSKAPGTTELMMLNYSFLAKLEWVQRLPSRPPDLRVQHNFGRASSFLLGKIWNVPTNPKNSEPSSENRIRTDQTKLETSRKLRKQIRKSIRGNAGDSSEEDTNDAQFLLFGKTSMGTAVAQSPSRLGGSTSFWPSVPTPSAMPNILFARC